MWQFGETSEAAMRALNIVVKRTGAPPAQAWSRFVTLALERDREPDALIGQVWFDERCALQAR